MQIEREFFEHILNCLANQKFIHELSPEMRSEVQASIDRVWLTGMDMLFNSKDIPDVDHAK